MLQITIPEREYFDDEKQEFTTIKEQTLTLEHSLISISKWESKWKKPFLIRANRTYAESIDYIRCMTLNSNVGDDVYRNISQAEFDKITEYIDDKMSATWFNDNGNINKRPGAKGQAVTSELIYYWMIAFNIPFECQKWHLNRLLTLIKICEIKNTPPKKMKKKDIYARNKSLNEARKRNLGTRG